MSQMLVSACLLGRRCRYDGESKDAAKVYEWTAAQQSKGVEVVPVCPEELGGLGTPRPAAGLRGGDGEAVWQGHARVETQEGHDVTQHFLAGAQAASESAPDATTAVLKARSPSCGCGQTRIDGDIQKGDGVFAALLRRRGVTVLTDEDLP